MTTIKYECGSYCVYDDNKLISNCDSRFEAESEMKEYLAEKELAEEAAKITLADVPF